MIIQGVNTILSSEIGISFKLAEGNNYRWAGYTKLHRVEAETINIREYVLDVIEGNPYPSIQKTIPAQNAGIGTIFSIAATDYLSFSMDGNISFGETLIRNESLTMYDVTGNLDFGLMSLIDVPINILFGGSYSTLTSIYTTQGDYSSTMQLKLLYSGSDSFSIGLEFYRSNSPINDNQYVRLTGAQFSCKFFFN